MHRLGALACIGLVALFGCERLAEWRLPEIVVAPIAEGVWVHTSWHRFPAGPFPSNGLVVATDAGAVLIDSAWSPAQMRDLLDWAERKLGGVRALVVTHAHDDRMAGLAEAHARGVASYAFSETVALARTNGLGEIEHALESGASLAALGIDGEIFFPGAGHVVDNSVVWLEGSGVLFGGCLVRAADGTSLGYVAEADVGSWPGAIAALEARYPEVVQVVPGHGAPGGAALLTHTQALLTAAAE